jgi:zinc transport system substrate-binding protein
MGMRTSFLALLMSIFFAAQLAAAPRVVTDIAPVHGLVARVMVGTGTPSLLVPPGASAHDFSLSPSKARELAEASVIFWVGNTFTPWLQKPISRIAENSLSVELLPLADRLLLPVRWGHSHHHSNEEYDPHAWLDPRVASEWLKVISKKLADIDLVNASKYEANAKAGQAEIEASVAALKTKLLPLKTTPFVSYHDAYQYFERRFELRFIGALADSDALPPSARRVAKLREQSRGYTNVCVITEPQYPHKLLDMVVSGDSIRHGVIDPLGSNIPNGPNFYISFLAMIGDVLSSCMRPAN